MHNFFETGPGLRLIFYGLFGLCTAVGIIMHRFSLWQFVTGRSKADESSASSPNDSELLSFYTAGHGLLNGGRVKFNDGIAATTYITDGDDAKTAYVSDPACIYSLDLPFNTQAHIIGLPLQLGLDRMQFELFLRSANMEKIVLEGDFRDYFDLYAAPDQDVAVREVMNPKSMEYVMDYCRSHFWEINDSQLYLVVNLAEQDKLDIGNTLAESLQFAMQLKPALVPGMPGAAPVNHESPYGVYDGPALACPICNKTMTLTDNWQVCPDNHGMLINGRELSQVHSKDLVLPEMTGASVEHGLLACPNCHNQMEATSYEGGGLTIDACTNCPYRWLDVDEVNAIRVGKLARLETK